MIRLNRLPLLWRVFAINAALYVVATALLLATPVTIHAPIALVEAFVLIGGLAVMLIANLLLLRPILGPLDRLIRRMQTVDLLRPGERLDHAGGGVEAGKLVRAFNQMLGRLEDERRQSTRRALAAQEAERLRIAHGLHDEVGQVLTGVLLQLDDVAEPNPDRRAALDETKQSVRQALEEVRRIAQELRPAMLEHLGLVSALTELASQFSRRLGIPVDRRFGADLPPLSDEVELAIYRVAQESLTNIARHAHASRAALSLERGTRSVVLRVSDDGTGFDEAVATAGGHGGVRGMRERAMLVGGALAVRSGTSGGTEIRLEAPSEES